MTELNPTLFKRFSRGPIAALITFTLGVATSLIWTFYSGPSPLVACGIAAPVPLVENLCSHEVVVPQELELTVGLRILEAECDEFSSSARVALDNYGPKAIRGYEIGTVQDYQYKRDVRSSTGVTSTGVLVAPGESEIVKFDGGFRTGKSYNRPTGPIRTVKFCIMRLDFTDGTSWQGELVPR